MSLTSDPPVSGPSADYERRFGDRFHSLAQLPPPEPPTNCFKSYPSKNREYLTVSRASQ